MTENADEKLDQVVNTLSKKARIVYDLCLLRSGDDCEEHFFILTVDVAPFGVSAPQLIVALDQCLRRGLINVVRVGTERRPSLYSLCLRWGDYRKKDFDSNHMHTNIPLRLGVEAKRTLKHIEDGQGEAAYFEHCAIIAAEAYLKVRKVEKKNE